MAEVYRHPELGFTIDPGYSWSLLEEGHDTAVLAIAAPDAPRPAIVTVTVQQVDPSGTAGTFADEAMAAYAATLGRLRLMEREDTELAGHAAVHVVFQRPNDDGEVAVADEWRLVQGTRGWVVFAYCPIEAYSQQASLIRDVASSLKLPPPAEAPSRRPHFQPASGTLSLRAGELRALTQLFEGDTSDREALDALREGGVVAGQVIEPRVSDMLALIRDASAKITVQRDGGVAALAWWHEGQVVFMLVVSPDERQLTTVTAGRLPGLLADLLDLGPRPTAADRPTLRVSIAEMAEAFSAPAASPAPEVATVLADIVGHRRSHWRVDVRLSDPDDYAILEAIDAPGGWWLVHPQAEQVALEPTTAGALWTHLAELAGESVTRSAS